MSAVRPVASVDCSFDETLRVYMLNRDAGLDIDASTSRCRWLGESMDYSQAIEGMMYLRDQALLTEEGAAAPS
jgi:hypothetical protein